MKVTQLKKNLKKLITYRLIIFQESVVPKKKQCDVTIFCNRATKLEAAIISMI